MAATIPTTEPESITSGDTTTWTRSLADYPATAGWVLTYALRLVGGGGEAVTIVGTASGRDHLLTATADRTQAWIAGEYSVQAYVASSTERYIVWTGTINVLPNFAQQGELDVRSKARIILDFIDASFAKLAAKQTVKATVEGVEFTFRSLEELMKARNYWANIVATEQAQVTGKVRGNLFSVFTRPGCTYPPYA